MRFRGIIYRCAFCTYRGHGPDGKNVKGSGFMSKLRVAVLFGGKSNEHDISRVSAAHIIKSIPKDKYDGVCIGITKKVEGTMPARDVMVTISINTIGT